MFNDVLLKILNFLFHLVLFNCSKHFSLSPKKGFAHIITVITQGMIVNIAQLMYCKDLYEIILSTAICTIIKHFLTQCIFEVFNFIVIVLSLTLYFVVYS